MNTLTIVHPTSIRSFQSQLLGTTALTQHGGFFKQAVSIAIAVAIPYAAPGIAASIGLSGTLGSALVGGAMGALGAVVTGGDPLLGAVGGAIGGGIGGFNAGAPVASTGGVNLAGDFAGANALGTGGAAFNASLAPAGLTAAPGVGDTFGGVGDSFGFGGSASDALASDFAGANALGGADLGSTLSGVSPGGAVSAPASTGGGFLGNIGDTASNFFDDLSSGNILGNKTFQQGASKLALKAAGSFLADDPSPAGRNATEAQLAVARAKQAALLDERATTSRELVTQAKNINPFQAGLTAQSLEQDRLTRAQEAGLRGISTRDTGLRQATIRRNALDRARLGGFRGGFDTAEKRRLATVAAASQTAPSGAGFASGIAGDLAAADARFRLDQRRADTEASGLTSDLTEIFGGIIPGVLTDEERAKRAGV